MVESGKSLGTGNDLVASAYDFILTAPFGNQSVGVGITYASGDSKPGDTDDKTFDNFYPTNHGKYRD